MDYGDRIDRNLVSILEANARTPASELARRVGLARSTVQERLDRLERRGVIVGYRAVLGRRAGEQEILAYLFLTLDPRHLRRLFTLLGDYPEITRAEVTSGAANVLCRVAVSHLEDIDALVGNLSQIEGVDGVGCSVVLSQKINREQSCFAS